MIAAVLDTVAALLARISDISHALSRCKNTKAQVEADVVHIAVGVYNTRFHQDGLEDSLLGEIDADELGSSNTGTDVVPFGIDAQPVPGSWKMCEQESAITLFFKYMA